MYFLCIHICTRMLLSPPPRSHIAISSRFMSYSSRTYLSVDTGFCTYNPLPTYLHAFCTNAVPNKWSVVLPLIVQCPVLEWAFYHDSVASEKIGNAILMQIAQRAIIKDSKTIQWPEQSPYPHWTPIELMLSTESPTAADSSTWGKSAEFGSPCCSIRFTSGQLYS